MSELIKAKEAAKRLRAAEARIKELENALWPFASLQQISSKITRVEVEELSGRVHKYLTGDDFNTALQVYRKRFLTAAARPEVKADE